MEDIHFNNPPIQEALIGVRLDFPNRLEQTLLDSFYELVKEDFPQKNFEMSTTIKFDTGAAEYADESSVNGIILRSSDGNKGILLNNEGFLFSYIGHYSNWTEFKAEAINYLEKVVSHFEVTSGDNLSTRFINRILIPKTDMSVTDVFETHLNVQHDYPKHFLIQFVKEYDDVKCNIVQTVDVASETPTHQAVILDIDSVYTSTSNLEAIMNADFVGWERLQQMKNETFTESITQRGKEMFA